MAFAQPLHLVTPSVDMDPITGYPVASPDVQGQPGGFQPPMRFEVPDEPPPNPVQPPIPSSPFTETTPEIVPSGGQMDVTPRVAAAPMPTSSGDVNAPNPNAPSAWNGLSYAQTGVSPAERDTRMQTSAGAGGDLRATARQIAQSQGLDPDLFDRLVTQESGYNPHAVSPAGAMGLTQLMPGTARSLGVNNPFDPIQSLQGGAKYLRQMIDYFKGDVAKGVMAYNAGPGNIERGIIPEETQRYVKALLGGAVQGAAAIVNPVGTAFNTLSSAASGLTPPRPQTGLSPDVTPYPTQGYQPQQMPPSLVQDMYTGQQQGLVPTPGTAPYQFPDLFGGARSALDRATQGAEGLAGVVQRGAEGMPVLGAVNTAAGIGLGNLTGQLRDTIASATLKVGTATNQAEFDSAMKSLQAAGASAAIQLTGNVNETPGMGAGEVPRMRSFADEPGYRERLASMSKAELLRESRSQPLWDTEGQNAISGAVRAYEDRASGGLRATLAGDPVPEGYVRVYRGEDAQGLGQYWSTEPVAGKSGKFFSSDLSVAEAFADNKRENGRIRYMDIPQSDYERLRAESGNPTQDSIQIPVGADESNSRVLMPDGSPAPPPAKPEPVRAAPQEQTTPGMGAGEVPAPRSNLPPVAPGMVRLYRSDSPPGMRGPETDFNPWHVASAYLEYIRSWRDANSPDSAIYYVDVPRPDSYGMLPGEPGYNPNDTGTAPTMITSEQRSAMRPVPGGEPITTATAPPAARPAATPAVRPPTGMGETPSQAWARMNAEAQAGMGTTPEAAISPDVPPVPVTPAGETPPPNPPPPVTGTGQAATQKPRQTYASLNESPLDTQVTRDLFTTDPYTVIHNADTMAGAAQRTLTDPLGALKRVLDESKPLDTNGIADAMQLARKAVNDGDMASIKAITKRLASEGTETAQKLQIFSQIDDLSPEGTIVELYRQLAKGTGTRKGVARVQKQLNEAEVEIIRQKAADRIAAVDELRHQSSVRVKTVQEAVQTQKAIPFDDFLKGMQDLLKETRPRAGAGAKTETLGMSIGLPTPGEPRSALEVAPEDAARFYQRGQDILKMTNGAERQAASDALFADIRAHKLELTKASRAEERAAAAAEKLKTTQAAREVAARKRDAATGLTQFEREQAQAVVQPVEAAKAERLRLQNEQIAADKAVRDAATQTAAREAAARKRDAATALAKFEREQAQAAIAPTVEQRSAAAQASLEQQKAQSYTESLASLSQQQQTSFERANASLEQQKAENPARSAAALGRQQVRETDAAALARESGITYLSDREARIAKEQIKRTMEEDIKIAMRRQVRQGDFELPDAVAQNLQDRATMLRNMPISTPNQKLEQLLAGQQLMGDLSRYAPKDQWGPILDLWGLSRAMETTLDNSYTLAQGGLRFLSNPVAGIKTLNTTMHIIAPQRVGIGRLSVPIAEGHENWGMDAAKSVSAQFLYGQHSKVLQESGLVYDDPFAVGRNNEFYPSQIAQKYVPGVSQSERAFASGGNKDRMDLYRRVVNGWLPDEMKGRSFDSIKEMATATGRDAQDFRDLATWFNVWTGKGQMNEVFRSGSPLLNLAFFAPRTFAAHLQVPYYAVKYGLTNSELRPVIAREMGGLALTLGAIYGGVAAYAKQNPDAGVKIQTDPLQSGFGDIQWHNHHINFLMGYGPLIHAIGVAQEGLRYQTGQAIPALSGIGGQRYNLHSANGKAYQENLGETLFTWLRGKLEPNTALLNDIRLGKDFSGNPVTTPSPRDPGESAAAQFFGQDPRTRGGWENLIRRFAQNYQPMAATDVAAAIKQDGIQGGALEAPFQFIGGRDNVYETTAALRNRTAADMGLGKDYNALVPFDKAKVDAAPEVQQAFAQQDASQNQVTDRARTQVTLENYQLRTKAIAEGWNDPQTGQHHYGLDEIVKQGITGPPLTAAIKAAQDAKYQAGLTTFNELYEAAKGQPIAPEARDALRNAYLAAEPVEDPNTHELDYTARDNQRAELLRQAVASGIDPNYLTQKVSPWKDPATAKAVDAYHADQDTLRPYYDMGKTLQASNPAFRAVVLEDMRLRAAAGTTQGALALQKFERETGLWHMYQADEQRQREMLRQKNAEIDAAGVRLGRWAPMPKIQNYPPNAASQKPFDFNNPPPMPAMPPMPPLQPMPTFPPMPAGIR